MRLTRLLSILLTITLAVALTLPSLADTGPAPTNDKQKIEKSVNFEQVSVAITIQEACRDVGTHYANTEVQYCHDAELPITGLFLDRPLRQCPSLYGYLQERLCNRSISKIRPPNNK